MGTMLWGTLGTGARAAGPGFGALLACARRAPCLYQLQIHCYRNLFISGQFLRERKKTKTEGKKKNHVTPLLPWKCFYPGKPQRRKEQKKDTGKATHFPKVLWKLLGCFSYSTTTIFSLWDVSCSPIRWERDPWVGRELKIKTNTEKLFVNCFTPANPPTRGFSNRLNSTPAEQVGAGDTRP